MIALAVIIVAVRKVWGSEEGMKERRNEARTLTWLGAARLACQQTKENVTSKPVKAKLKRMH